MDNIIISILKFMGMVNGGNSVCVVMASDLKPLGFALSDYFRIRK